MAFSSCLLDPALRSHSCAPGKQGSPSPAVPRGAAVLVPGAAQWSYTSWRIEMTPKGVLDRSSSCFFLTSTKNHKIMGLLSLEKPSKMIKSIL